MSDELGRIIQRVTEYAPKECRCTACGIAHDLEALLTRYDLTPKKEPEQLPLVTREMIANAWRRHYRSQATEPALIAPESLESHRDVVRQSIEATLERLPRWRENADWVSLADDTGPWAHLPSLRRALLGDTP